MASLRTLVATSVLTTLALAQGTPTNGTACAQVSASVAAQRGLPTPTVAAGLAYDCLQSVRLNTTAALTLIERVKPYFDWQSTTDWLKDPPQEYVEKVQPAHDIFGELEALKANVQSGALTKEYEFGWALYRITQKAHDGHFTYVPDSVGELFNWARPVPLISVSNDGQSVPVPYAYADVLAASFGNTTFQPSEIVQIDGVNAKDFLEDWSQYGSLQDRDALYNNVFYQLAQVSLGSSGSGMGTFAGGGRGRWVYPGDKTTLTFANGTTSTYQNVARVLVSFAGIATGEELASRWFHVPGDTLSGINQPGQVASNSTSSVAPTSTVAEKKAFEEVNLKMEESQALATPAPGYPEPIIRHGNNFIGGYYIDEAGYEDIAVLGIPSFVGGGTNNPQLQFQSVARTFISKAKADGKRKLIIDVSANGGGTILLGYDLFKQLFPEETAFAAYDRFRNFETTRQLGEKFSEVAGRYPPNVNSSTFTGFSTFDSEIGGSIFNHRQDTKPDTCPFASWDEKIGPVANKGDQYSAAIRWNLADPLNRLTSGGLVVSNEPEPKTEQPFAVENIIFLTDGYCASTCTIFSQLLRDNVGVKFASIGGRSSRAATQAIGGVKGTNNFAWAYIQQQVSYIYNWSTPAEATAYDQTSLINYNDDTVFYRAATGVGAGINFRDGIKKNDTEGVPLQFVYEDSDCRLYYTAEMTVDVTEIWKAVADSAWGDNNRCAVGSLGATSTYARTRRHATNSINRHLSGKHGSIQDYPMDVYTDVRGMGDYFGWMLP